MTSHRVVTEAEIAAADPDRPFVVDTGRLVTPAARDLARHRGVTLVETGPGHGPDPEPLQAVALGADHGGVTLKAALIPVVEQLDFNTIDLGTSGPEPVDYPVYAARVAEAVAEGAATFGIMIDGAGIGSAMVANRIPGCRAACCHDVTTAHNAREHNNANLLTLGGGLVGPRLAAEIVTAFLTTGFGGGRHERRVAMIDALDRPPAGPA